MSDIFSTCKKINVLFYSIHDLIFRDKNVSSFSQEKTHEKKKQVTYELKWVEF